jgi:hypothetical protein
MTRNNLYYSLGIGIGYMLGAAPDATWYVQLSLAALVFAATFAVLMGLSAIWAEARNAFK